MMRYNERKAEKEARENLARLMSEFPQLPVVFITPNELMQGEVATMIHAGVGEVVEYFGKAYDPDEFRKEYYAKNCGWLNYTFKYYPHMTKKDDEIAVQKTMDAKIRIDRYIDREVEANTIRAIIVRTDVFRREDE